MPQIFHPSMNTIARVSIFGGLGLVAGAIVVAGIVARSPYATEAGVIRSQPIPFSHAHHVGDSGIDCRYCHRSVETSAFAGMPSTQICMDCHSQLWMDSKTLAPVRESFRSGKPLVWTRVHDLPDYVYFHHGIHVQKGVACQTCHGPVDQMPLMWREKSLHMEWCLNCHRHPERFVRPTELVSAIDWKPNQETPSAGTDLVRIHSVRSKTDCSVCHH